MLRSVGLRSDILSMRGFCEVTEFQDRIVMRTPTEPEYWSGNAIIMRDAPTDPAVDLAQFGRDFPDAKHAKVIWDVPGMNAGGIRDALSPSGIKVEQFDVLARDGVIGTVAPPKGIVFRALSSNADWDAVLALQIEIGIEDGYPIDAHSAFLKRRNITRRTQIASGLGAWFGAFDGDALVAQMGLFHDDSIARYQWVSTRASHRRRGICTGLLVYCYRWMQTRAPDAQVVIIAEADSDAGRLYRKMGFAHVETVTEATRVAY